MRNLFVNPWSSGIIFAPGTPDPGESDRFQPPGSVGRSKRLLPGSGVAFQVTVSQSTLQLCSCSQEVPVISQAWIWEQYSGQVSAKDKVQHGEAPACLRLALTHPPDLRQTLFPLRILVVSSVNLDHLAHHCLGSSHPVLGLSQESASLCPVSPFTGTLLWTARPSPARTWPSCCFSSCL